MLARLIFLITRPLFLLCLVLFWIGWLIWLWQPQRQVQLHQQNFLKAISNKNWNKAALFISDKYADRWRHEKEVVVREGKEITFHFITLEIRSEQEEVSADGPKGSVRARLILEGIGNPIAELAKQQVAALQSPFVFDWKRTGWAPWSWELTRIDNPDLVIPEAGSWLQ